MLVDAHGFVDAVRRERMPALRFPSGFTLFERESIGRIAVDLVGAAEDEDRIGAMPARGLKQDKRAVGIDAEIRQRFARRPVMRGLRGGVNDDRYVAAIAGEDLLDGARLADIGFDMSVEGQILLELLPGPTGAGVWPKKSGAHRCRCRRPDPLRLKNGRLGPMRPPAPVMMATLIQAPNIGSS